MESIRDQNPGQNVAPAGSCEEELSSAKWMPQAVTMSGATDCYQPAEKQFKLTRKCLEVFAVKF